MNLLEIEQDCAWWFEAATREEMGKLLEHSLRCVNRSEREVPYGRVFYLAGDSLTFNLQPGTFDEIRITKTSPRRGRALEQRVRSWLTPGGRIVSLENNSVAPDPILRQINQPAQFLEPAQRSLVLLLGSF